MNERGDMSVSVDSRVLRRLMLIGVAAAFAITLQFALDAAAGQLLFMTLCVVVLMVLAIVFRAERRLPLLCDPLVIVMAFLAQFYVIGAPALFVLDFYLFRPMSPERGVLILGLFSVLVAAFFIGYQMSLGQTVADLLPDFERSRRRMPWIWLETAIVGAGLLGCLAYISLQGGVGKMVNTGAGQSQSTGKPIFQLAYHVLLAGTFLMAWRLNSREGARRATWTPLIALILAEVIFFGVISGARKWLFYMFFGLLCMRLLRNGVRSIPRMRIAVLFAVLIVFFSFWGTVRSHSLTEIVSGRRSEPRAAARIPWYMGYFKSVAEPFEVASLVVDIYPAQRPYEYGRTVLVTVFGFIPRSVWPEKPVGIGKTMTRYTDGYLFQETTGHSLAITLLGDFYANLGVVGVVVGGLFFGIVCRTFAAYAATGMKAGVQLSAARVLIPSAFVGGLAEVRGDSATILAYYAMVLVPIVVVCATSRLEPRPGGE